MNRQILPAIFCAIVTLCSLSSARATVLVYEGFHEGDWTGITASGGQQLQKGKTTGSHSTGFVANSSWSVSDSTTQLYVSGTDYGLSLPTVMVAKGFTTCGGAAQGNSQADKNELRGGCHAFATDTLKVSSGTLYVRALLRLTTSAAAKLNSVETPAGNSNGSYCGFGLIGSTSASRYPLTTTSNKSSCSFLMWKNKNSSGELVLSLCLIDASGALTLYPLVTGFTVGSTYLCYAEIRVGAGTDGKEYVRAGAMDTADFTGAAYWTVLGGSSESVEVQLITDSYYPKAMAYAAPYGTNGGVFRADELVVGTELGDILPTAGLFAVSAIGTPTVGQDSFSTDWTLFADAGVTADAGLVYFTDEAFTTATTNSLGTGLAADTRTASLSNLEPATAYWWKIYADNGTEVAETSVFSFSTLGAPALGTATVTASEESATFSVELTEAALVNTLATSVSVFYGIDGETWTELPIGSSSTATNWTATVGNLGYGTTYQWFVRATATMAGGRVLSAESSTKTFTTPSNGDMYVNVATTNAVEPYATAETAAPNIATALALATDGATIHVAPGLYPITVPLTISKAIRILGDDPDPSRVVVSNKTGAGYKNGNQRVFYLDNANASVANLTMQKGQSWGSAGSSFYITSNGGTVSNCVVEAGETTGNSAFSAGAVLNAGRVTHTIFRKCKIGSNSTSDGNGSYRTAVLNVKGDAVAENCLLIDNTQASEKALTIVRIEGTATMRNCTIVDSGLGTTNAYCNVFTPIYISSANATVQNVVVAGITNRIDGALCRPAWGQPARFLNGATDADISGISSFPAETIVGTAAEFFKDYANGDYTPRLPTKELDVVTLVNKGANYEGMASVDLAGKARKSGKIVDIGCYEFQLPNGLFILVR